MRLQRSLLLITALAIAIGVSAQQIYRTVDENGKVVFTDAPPAKASSTEAVDIRHINTTPGLKTEQRNKAASSAPQAPSKAALVEQEVRITQPKQEETIPNGPGNFSVAVKVKPKLRSNQSLQLFIDGVPYNQPQRAATWSLTNIFRGQHELTVGIVESDGEANVMSPPVTVYVQRPRIR